MNRAVTDKTNTVVVKRPQKCTVATVAASVIRDATGAAEVVTQYDVPLDLDSQTLAALRAAAIKLAARLQGDIRWVEEKEREEPCLKPTRRPPNV